LTPGKYTSPLGRTLSEYAVKVRSFSRNARLYLLNVIIVGAAMGVFRLLFNFYVLSLGFDEALLGRLITTSSLTALLAALPMGYLADILGRKKSLLISGALTSSSIMVMVLWPTEGTLYGMNVVSGIGQSLWAVTMAPFLMENSGEKERTYLFSFSSGLQMAMASVGNWIGGYLPAWMGAYQDVDPESSIAYASALAVVALVATLGMLPVAMLKVEQGEKAAHSFDPFGILRQKPGLLTRLLLPSLIISTSNLRLESFITFQ